MVRYTAPTAPPFLSPGLCNFLMQHKGGQTVSNMSQLLAWTLKRYVRFVAIGALAMCAAVNVALHVGAGLTYICEEECTLHMIGGRVSPYNKHILEYIRDNMLEQGAPYDQYKPSHDIKNPPWTKLGRWGDAHKFVIDYFSNYNEPGRYVEVGAQDGEFMSLTAHLEARHFEGLLIEPNPKDYLKLRAKRRHAMTINACASPIDATAKLPLWIRHNSGNLPSLLNRVQEGSNRLFTYVAKEDRELGVQVTVQCFPLATMVQAAFRVPQVDLMTISTHGGELDILATLPTNFLVRVLIVMTPLASDEEVKFMNTLTSARNMTMAYSKSNVHIFLPTGEVRRV